MTPCSSRSLTAVAYPSSIDNGVCPSAFPVRLPTLYVEVDWIIHDFANQWYDNATHPFVLSTGDPTGYGSHGAFQNGWDVNILQQALNTCDSSSSIEECPPLQNYTQSNDVQTSCSLGTPLLSLTQLILANPFPEQVLGSLDQLPGCNPVQWGPNEATVPNLCSFTKVFSNFTNTVSGSGYLTYTKFNRYSTAKCADRCVSDPGNCIFFNHYEENRPSGRSFICTLWSVTKTAADATNYPDNMSLNVTHSAGYALNIANANSTRKG